MSESTAELTTDAPETTEVEESVTEEQLADGQEPESVDDLPDWAQEEIRKLRRENATARIKARDAARKGAKPDTPPEATRQSLKAAEDRGRAEARMEYGIQLAGAEIKASLAGAFSEEQITDIIEDLNLTRYVEDDGSVDRDAVRALKDKYTALLGKKPPARVSHGRSEKPPSGNEDAEFARTLFGS